MPTNKVIIGFYQQRNRKCFFWTTKSKKKNSYGTAYFSYNIYVKKVESDLESNVFHLYFNIKVDKGNEY